MGVSSQRYAPATLYPRERTQRPTGWEAGLVSQLLCKQRLEEKSLTSTADRTPGVRPVVRHYTDWATPTPKQLCIRVELVQL
jgi:hypothetical protein